LSVVDSVTESASRWLASRSTRRSFLGRMGRTAVFVASGSTMAMVLGADEAHARVCGQSGVSPKCPTYDCNDVWGWCWYANGCCAGGALKKICDCCAVNWPNVHGYCPSGTNVKCIVESCGTDPRVQVVSLVQLPYDDPVTLSAAATRAARGNGSTEHVYVVAADQPLWAAVVRPLSLLSGSGVLLSGGRLAASTVSELQRLGVRRATLVGPTASPGLERYGITVDRRGQSHSVEQFSLEVASVFRSGGTRSAFVSRATAETAVPASAAAAAAGKPLIIGTSTNPGFDRVYLAGWEASAEGSRLPGAYPLWSDNLPALAVELADAAVVLEGGDMSSVVLAPSLSPAVLSFGGPALLHSPGTIDGARDWLFARRSQLRRIALSGAGGALSTASYYELQSLANGFDAHRLIGVGGQGLPVIEQPLAERPIGRARI
jgi:hypothetical protein